VLVTALQHAHNWTAKNDRNKMSFWLDVLFDEESGLDDPSTYPVMLEFRPGVAKLEVQHWLERNSRMCDKAVALLRDYHKNRSDRPPGPLAPISPLAWNWLPDKNSGEPRADDLGDHSKVTPDWDENEVDKFKQDAGYVRVSREIDTWWLSARDPNYDDWVVPMPSVEFAKTRTDHCKVNLIRRYTLAFRRDVHEHYRQQCQVEGSGEDEAEVGQSQEEEEYDDPIIQDDEEDDDSYGEGPMTGLLTEVPNILDPKQIEALHLIVKSCILDTQAVGLTKAGENLQKTRCRMFLAADCGKSLLREMLVYIAVWEQPETSLIFQITTQIIEAIHHSALLPYAWDSLRIPKDIISPAQTVLLRLTNHMFHARKTKVPAPEQKELLRDVKLVYFLFASFRSRVVPECVALMHLQAQIRQDLYDPVDFPVDNWDMERAKDGLAQFLDFLVAIVEMDHIRRYLVEWDVAYELITLLKALEDGVEKKPLVKLPNRSANRPNPNSPTDTTIDHQHWDISHVTYADEQPVSPPPPPMQDPAHLFPWPSIKIQILTILAGLLAPPPGRSSPGNPDVQRQIINHNGVMPMLNCCVYDDHNKYARERVQICLKWLMDGSAEANNIVRNIVAVSGQPQAANPYGPPPAQPDAGTTRPTSATAGQTPPLPVNPAQAPRPNLSSYTLSPGAPLPPLDKHVQSIRIDGVSGEVKIQFGDKLNTSLPRAPSQTSTTARPPSSSSSSGPTFPSVIQSSSGPLSISELLAVGKGTSMNSSVRNAGISRLAAGGYLSDPAALSQTPSLASLQQNTMAARAPPPMQHAASGGGHGGGGGGAGGAGGGNSASSSSPTAAAISPGEGLSRDIVALADDAGKLDLGRDPHVHGNGNGSGHAGGNNGAVRGAQGHGDGDETEEENFM
jgi:hypothetical protein